MKFSRKLKIHGCWKYQTGSLIVVNILSSVNIELSKILGGLQVLFTFLFSVYTTHMCRVNSLYHVSIRGQIQVVMLVRHGKQASPAEPSLQPQNSAQQSYFLRLTGIIEFTNRYTQNVLLLHYSKDIEVVKAYFILA